MANKNLFLPTFVSLMAIFIFIYNLSLFALAACFEFLCFVISDVLVSIFCFLVMPCGCEDAVCVKRNECTLFFKPMNVPAGLCFHAANATDWCVYLSIKYFASMDLFTRSTSA